MTTSRHLVASTVARDYIDALASTARLPVGGDVALGPLLDATQRDQLHQMVTERVGRRPAGHRRRVRRPVLQAQDQGSP
jgi:acyl-CoA reductase-like NAD-dependent aldehyde dehydrogenase